MNDMSTTNDDWYAPLQALQSAGKLAAKATSLAGLHERREATQGQYFTPNPVADLMWQVGVALTGKQAGDGLQVLDNAIGSGRLVQFARPGDRVFGADTDGEATRALEAALKDAGISSEIEHCSLTDLKVSGMDLAVINPPFSLRLQSPHLEAFDCCTFGPYGPHSSALSHWYALYQAHAAAAVTVALVPSPVLSELPQHPKLASSLVAAVHLPASTFVEEGASVQTVILAFSRNRAAPVSPLEARGLAAGHALLPELSNLKGLAYPAQSARFAVRSLTISEPSITGPVTGNAAVRLYRDGRRLNLGFSCALTKAKVLNAVMDHKLGYENHLQRRYPKGIEYAGSARLLIEVLLTGTSPTEYLDHLCGIIQRAGGNPQPDTQLLGYLKKRWRAIQIEKTPMQRTIFQPGGSAADLDGAEVVSLKHHLSNPADFMSPLIAKGAKVRLVRDPLQTAPRYRYHSAPQMPALSADELRLLVALPATNGGGWRQIATGRAAAFPAKAAQLRRRLDREGVASWLGSWTWQPEDVIELSMTRGAVAGHQMGLGKSRIAAGCCLLGGKHNAIIVEAGLVAEMVEQFKLFGLPESSYQVLRTPEQARQLRRINLISYQTLRAVLPGQRRKTFAHLLRRRLHTVCADEGSLLAHSGTAQTRALHHLSARRRIALDGTPLPNLPRNLLPVVQWCSRDGTASQPFGVRGPYICSEIFSSAYSAQRGLDVFADLFVTTEWVTHTFADDLQTGGKREIPSLRNLDLYREWVGLNVLRRVWGEPAIAAHATMPVPETETVTIPWDAQHLAHYLEIAESFADWWKKQRAETDARKLNMAAVLMRLNAACRATSIPQDQKGPSPWRGGLTSKQRWAVDKLEALDRAGEVTLCFVESPVTAELLASQLRQRGINVITYAGTAGPKKRAAKLNQEFRTGQVRTMIITYAVGARGLNLPEVSVTLFCDRMWSPRQEAQALFRAQRVGRKGTLRAIYAHLDGSPDIYKAQMVAFKADTALAGLDYAEPEFRPDEFQHWMTILDDFCESIGVKRLELVRSSKAAA